MSIVVVGSVALDSLETPFGKVENALGGSATHFSVAASFFTRVVKLVGIVGDDFPPEHIDFLMTSRDEGFGLPLLEAGMIKLPIACPDIPPFMEVGRDICFFHLDDPPIAIAGRIMEYLGRTNTHKMFRHIMGKYILSEVCKNQLLPYLFKITGRATCSMAPIT